MKYRYSFSSIRNKTQTEVINVAIKRMLENKVHFLDVWYVSTYIFRSVRNVRNRTTAVCVLLLIIK